MLYWALNLFDGLFEHGLSGFCSGANRAVGRATSFWAGVVSLDPTGSTGCRYPVLDVLHRLDNNDVLSIHAVVKRVVNISKVLSVLIFVSLFSFVAPMPINAATPDRKLELPGPTWGGEGGGPKTISCPTGYVSSGVGSSIAKAGFVYMFGFGIICSRVNIRVADSGTSIDFIPGDTVQVPMVDFDGSDFESISMCSEDEVLVGITMDSSFGNGEYIQDVAPRCAMLKDVFGGKPIIRIARDSTRNDISDQLVSDCTRGFVAGMQGRTGEGLDKNGVLCASLRIGVQEGVSAYSTPESIELDFNFKSLKMKEELITFEIPRLIFPNSTERSISLSSMPGDDVIVLIRNHNSSLLHSLSGESSVPLFLLGVLEAAGTVISKIETHSDYFQLKNLTSKPSKVFMFVRYKNSLIQMVLYEE